MKKNEEQLLKYLSDLLNEKEKKELEQKLENSIELKSKYENILKKLQQFSDINDIELDERYFVSLLPRVHERLSDVKSNTFVKKIVYSAPILIVVLIVFLLLPKSSQKFEEQLKTLTQEVVNNFDSDVEIKYLNDYPVEQIISLDTKSKNEIDVSFIDDFELPKEYINKHEQSLLEEYINLDNFSDEELAILYNDLSKIKFK